MEQRLDAREVSLGEYNDETALTYGEVSHLLNQIVEKREKDNERIDPMLIRCRDHVSKFNKIIVSQTEMGVREFMKTKNLHEFEIATLINNIPESVEHAKELQPSIRRLNISDIQEIVEILEHAYTSSSQSMIL